MNWDRACRNPMSRFKFAQEQRRLGFFVIEDCSLMLHPPPYFFSSSVIKVFVDVDSEFEDAGFFYIYKEEGAEEALGILVCEKVYEDYIIENNLLYYEKESKNKKCFISTSMPENEKAKVNLRWNRNKQKRTS